MYGQITKFRDDIGVGVIAAENGRKYRFVKSEILNDDKRLVGTEVDFVVVASRPRQIITMTGSPWTAFGGICARAANDQE
jgi:cold shock CspA family protein